MGDFVVNDPKTNGKHENFNSAMAARKQARNREVIILLSVVCPTIIFFER